MSGVGLGRDKAHCEHLPRVSPIWLAQSGVGSWIIFYIDFINFGVFWFFFLCFQNLYAFGWILQKFFVLCLAAVRVVLEDTGELDRCWHMSGDFLSRGCAHGKRVLSSPWSKGNAL